MSTEADARQDDEWEALYQKLSMTLRTFGTEDHFGNADYLIVDDNYGWRRHTIEIHKLPMLSPTVVKALQALLDDFPEWEIVIALDIPGTEQSWPRMGLTIRKREIIDGLQRQYLPSQFRAYVYEGSRPGTGYD